MAKTPDYFQGKTIIITGSGSGVGRQTALIFAREGANVVGLDVNTKGGQETADMVSEKGVRNVFIETDITSRPAVQSAVARAIAEFGSIDFLFNCAGAAFRRCKFLEIDDGLMERTFDLNVNGTFYTMQELLPHMLERGQGVIVNVASLAHKRGGPGASVHYAAAKGAVLSMTLGVGREFADRGIRCLSISPASINTPFMTASDTSEELLEQFRQGIPMKRFAEPDELGELVLFMCSDACPYMTADTVYVSGGSGWR